jgi:hypothetical protein
VSDERDYQAVGYLNGDLTPASGRIVLTRRDVSEEQLLAEHERLRDESTLHAR